MSFPRDLTTREREVLAAMIERGVSFEGEALPWKCDLDAVRVWGTCGCGTCPSVALGMKDAPAQDRGPRVILEASCPGAMLLLFIDDGNLSYLELAPIEAAAAFDEFPPVSEIDFSG